MCVCVYVCVCVCVRVSFALFTILIIAPNHHSQAWRRILVHPQPGTSLKRARMTIPTLRGEITMSFERSEQTFQLTLGVPGNTLAEVCLPVALLAHSTSMTLDGRDVTGVTPDGRPGQLCLPDDVGAGTHVVVARSR